jgi:ABC-2 type transport system permease protein
MNLHIFSLTIGQIAGQRRTVLMLLFATIPILIAVVFRIAARSDADPLESFGGGMDNLIVGVILPLTALVFGTAALGQELEDGTAVYLLGKPLPRWRIFVEKAAAAWVATSAVLVVSVVGTGLVLLAGESGYRAIPAFAVAVTLGGLAYVAVFVALSVAFNRALIIGLVYVFVWEALVTQLVGGARYLSVREFTLGIAAALADVPSAVLDASVGPVESVALLAVVAAGAALYGAHRLGSYQIGERT